MNSAKAKIALMLPGGGARGSYQVGVLKGIMEIIPHAAAPFPIITGTSAGAINATVLASYANDIKYGTARLEKFWTTIHCHDIYKTSSGVIAKTILRVIGSIVLSGFGVKGPKSLLDNTPLQDLLTRELHLEQIETVINTGHLDGLAITASSYETAVAISFFQAQDNIQNWDRTRRFGRKDKIGVEHIM
ncbi:MAG: patatin-like phospholipase family protein, partial [Proteobacteria bacterium]|nr:patatin-like phospholipase family protein [Pseudomonadota bacterium]